MHNGEITIDKGIPIPKSNKAGATRWPWRSLGVGDSFLVPKKDNEPHQSTSIRATSVVSFARRQGVKLVSRREGDDGYRIWRVE